MGEAHPWRDGGKEWFFRSPKGRRRDRECQRRSWVMRKCDDAQILFWTKKPQMDRLFGDDLGLDMGR